MSTLIDNAVIVDPGDTSSVDAIVGSTTDQSVGTEALVEEDLLVEEISIDGMCGVY